MIILDNNNSLPELRVAVRELVDHVLRTGSMGKVSYDSALSAARGTRIHQAFFKKINDLFPGWRIREEVSISLPWSESNIKLRVSGRADLLLEVDPSSADGGSDFMPEGIVDDVSRMVVEVKSVDLPLDELNPKGNPLHWAQCQLYAYMIASLRREERKLAGQPDDMADQTVTYALTYVSADSLESTFIYRQTPFSELENDFNSWCAVYAAWGTRLLKYKEKRSASCKLFPFPYPSLREGQKELSTTVLHNIKDAGTLLAEAPTGIGKTISTLYPALKALGHGLCDRIVYLTARTSVREIASQALSDMRAVGLYVRDITLTAKERICFRPDIFCETNLCEFADGYYDRLLPALEELLETQAINREVIEECARSHKLCPHELSIDAARYCDVVIGDYNHAFDPRSRLSIFGDTQTRDVFLVDEAHNLPDRARVMFSAALSYKEFREAAKALHALKPELVEIIAPILDTFKILKRQLKESNPALNAIEPSIDETNVLSAENFRSASSKMPRLTDRLQRFIKDTQKLLDQIEDYDIKKPILNAFFSARHFNKICDWFWADDYIIMLRDNGKDLILEQTCLDVARQLRRSRLAKDTHIYFSATLTPLSYYEAMLCGRELENPPDHLILPSPFDAGHLNLLIHPLSTLYKDRQSTAPRLGMALALAVSRQAINTLIYFPSYAYMKLVYPWFRQALKDERHVIVQKKGMKESESAAFLQNFRTNEGRPTVGLAVLGGIFNEGIDLAGERLGGVICVGAGLPQLSPEREILKNYFDTRGLNGFLFAYVYPGFNKIMQAAGRLIRSERDRGYVLLIDERYLNHEYAELFPRYWHPMIAADPRELGELLDETPQIE